MAATNALPKGFKTSIKFTPQAHNDILTLSEDEVGGDGFQVNGSGDTNTDILANDGGGNAKTIYAITTDTEAEVKADLAHYVGSTNPTQPLANSLNFSQEIDDVTYTGVLTLDTSGNVNLVVDGANGLDDGETLNFNFTYLIRMGDGTFSVATATIAVEGSNDAPEAADDTYEVNEDATLTTTAITGVLNNDSDPDIEDIDVASVNGVADGDALDLDAAVGSIKVSLTSGALVTVDTETGAFVYDQNGAFDALNDGEDGQDSFTYQATDGTANSGDATVNITIHGVTDVPEEGQVTAGTDFWVVTNATQFQIPVEWMTWNDTTTGNGPINVTSVTGLPPGITAVDADNDGNIDFLNVSSSGGTDFTFNYTAEDDDGNTSTGEVNVDVIQPTGNGTDDGFNLTLLSYDFSYIDAKNGADTVTEGGSATNFVTGGAGKDTLVGSNTSVDTFIYTNEAESQIKYQGGQGQPAVKPTEVQSDSTDIISAFTSGTDKIDLSALDVSNFDSDLSDGLAAHSFALVFSGGNTEVFVNTSNNVEQTTVDALFANTTYNVDMQIHVTGAVLTQTDFLV